MHLSVLICECLWLLIAFVCYLEFSENPVLEGRMGYNQDAIEGDKASFIGWQIRLGIFIGVLTCIGWLLYDDILIKTYQILEGKRDASHGYLIPFISIYLIWIKKDRLKTLTAQFSLIYGVAIICIGLLLFLVTKNNETVLLPMFSYYLLVVGMVVGLFGNVVFKELRFPVLFIATLIPLPQAWYIALGNQLRYVGLTSVDALQLMGVSIYNDGIMVFLPNCDVKVIHACSGVRYLLPFIVLGLAYGHLYKKTIKAKILVVLVMIPLTLAASFFRLFFVFLGINMFGCFMAGRPHTYISWAVFVMMMGGAVIFDIFLEKRNKDKPKTPDLA